MCWRQRTFPFAPPFRVNERSTAEPRPGFGGFRWDSFDTAGSATPTMQGPWMESSGSGRKWKMLPKSTAHVGQVPGYFPRKPSHRRLRTAGHLLSPSLRSLPPAGSPGRTVSGALGPSLGLKPARCHGSSTQARRFRHSLQGAVT